MAAACGGESPTEGVVAKVQGSLLSVAGDGQVGNLGRPLSDSLIVRVVDPSGNVLPGVTVNWGVGDGSVLGMVRPTAGLTNSAGLAQVRWTLGINTGAQTATVQMATARVVGASPVTFTATTPSLVPLIDLGAATYFGFPGGLYPGGNVMPQAHADAGQALAAAVEPLDVNGNPSTDGKYVLLSIGGRNTELIYCGESPCLPFTFTGKALADPDVDTHLAIVEGASDGTASFSWQSSAGAQYDRIRDEELEPFGLSEQQVQVVWLKAKEWESRSPFPGNTNFELSQLGNVARALKSRYPNLRLVFLGSRMYGGYVVPDGRHEEPLAYETGLKMKWLIEAQIDQMANGGTIVDVGAGDLNYNTVAPWIGWGPYFWADGLNARSDGLFWPSEDFFPDGVHQTDAGKEKAATLLLEFFKTSPQTRCWFLVGESC